MASCKLSYSLLKTIATKTKKHVKADSFDRPLSYWQELMARNMGWESFHHAGLDPRLSDAGASLGPAHPGSTREHATRNSTLLHLSIARADSAAMRQALLAGADPNQADCLGQSAYERCLGMIDASMARELFNVDFATWIAPLMDAGANLLASGGRGGKTILAMVASSLHPHYCDKRHFAENTSLLLRIAAACRLAVKACDLSRRTPLHEAAYVENAALIEFLIECGADVDAPDADGATALMQAVVNGNLPCVTKLLDCGAAFPREIDINGQRSLHRLCLSEIHRCSPPDEEAIALGDFLFSEHLRRFGEEPGCIP